MSGKRFKHYVLAAFAAFILAFSTGQPADASIVGDLWNGAKEAAREAGCYIRGGSEQDCAAPSPTPTPSPSPSGPSMPGACNVQYSVKMYDPRDMANPFKQTVLGGPLSFSRSSNNATGTANLTVNGSGGSLSASYRTDTGLSLKISALQPCPSDPPGSDDNPFTPPEGDSSPTGSNPGTGGNGGTGGTGGSGSDGNGSNGGNGSSGGDGGSTAGQPGKWGDPTGGNGTGGNGSNGSGGNGSGNNGGAGNNGNSGNKDGDGKAPDSQVDKENPTKPWSFKKPNFVAYAVGVFSNKFPFDFFKGIVLTGDAPQAAACPTYTFFEKPFELCPIRDFFALLKYPILIGFFVWAVMAI